MRFRTVREDKWFEKRKRGSDPIVLRKLHILAGMGLFSGGAKMSYGAKSVIAKSYLSGNCNPTERH